MKRCRHGHDLDDNPRVYADGRSRCRECHRARVRKNDGRRSARCWRCRKRRGACVCVLSVAS